MKNDFIDFRPWYVGGVNPQKGRTIVIAIEFGSSMDRNKKAVETLLEKVLLLTGTQDKVWYSIMT